MGLRAALYLRVSTTTQDTERQEDQLRAVAAARGWDIVEVYADNTSIKTPSAVASTS